jgi:hypothetical protein
MLEPSKREALLLKELDHLQSIVGRSDNFFSLTKQLCLGSVGYLFFQYSGSDKQLYLALVPLAFFAMEVTYRYAYWSKHLLRIAEIRGVLIAGTSESVTPAHLYKMIPIEENVCRRMGMTIKYYDLFFYCVLLSGALIIGKYWLFLIIEIVAVVILWLIKYNQPEDLG